MIHILICNESFEVDVELIHNFHSLDDGDGNNYYLVFGSKVDKLLNFLLRLNLDEKIIIWFHLGKDRTDESNGKFKQLDPLYMKFQSKFTILNRHPYFLTRGNSLLFEKELKEQLSSKLYKEYIKHLRLYQPQDILWIPEISSMAITVEQILGASKNMHPDYKFKLKDKLLKSILAGIINKELVQDFKKYNELYLVESNIYIEIARELNDLDEKLKNGKLPKRNSIEFYTLHSDLLTKLGRHLIEGS